MSGRVGDLSPKQEAALEKFRVNVRDVLKPEHDDYYLLRWLRARNFDQKKAETMLRSNMAWRQKVGADTVLKDFKTPEVVEKYYPGGWSGVDKEGSPVWIDPTGNVDIKGILRSSKKADVIKSKVVILEEIYKGFDEVNQKNPGRRVDQTVIIFDFENFGLKHLWKPGVDVFCEMLSVFEDYYPETLKISFVINAPRIFPIAFNLVKPFLSEETVRKIHILGTHYKETLLKYIDDDQLPVHWGGTCRDPDGDPKCRSKINIGGEVPQRYYSQPSLEMDNCSEVSVGRGSSLQLDYEITVPDSAIRWQFSTDGFDIGFGIFRRTKASRQKAGEMDTFLVSERVNSHLVPEDGSVKCKETGTYVVRFDNTYSWARSKKVFYIIEVLEPDNDDFEMPSDTASESGSYGNGSAVTS